MTAAQAFAPAAMELVSDRLILSGRWTAMDLGSLGEVADPLPDSAPRVLTADATALAGLDTAGAWILHSLLLRWRARGIDVSAAGFSSAQARLMAVVEAQHRDQAAHPPVPAAGPGSPLVRLGRLSADTGTMLLDLLAFTGETTLRLAACCAHPGRLRWRTILVNVRMAGVDALPIVGLLAFLLGIVVAYQGADQLRRYGANIYVTDLIGLSMLREFAPLITAIILAGRSGSAYAAQIGTMAVTEEIDALRTLGIEPFELLVLPKLLALLIVMPLLTVFADVLGVLGGMVMARGVLDVGFPEFLARFNQAVSATSYLIGIGKAPVFAAAIVIIGCFEGFRTHGGADSVGAQTTRSVVEAIFLVVVLDAMFSVLFSVLGL